MEIVPLRILCLTGGGGALSKGSILPAFASRGILGATGYRAVSPLRLYFNTFTATPNVAK